VIRRRFVVAPAAQRLKIGVQPLIDAIALVRRAGPKIQIRRDARRIGDPCDLDLAEAGPRTRIDLERQDSALGIVADSDRGLDPRAQEPSSRQMLLERPRRRVRAPHGRRSPESFRDESPQVAVVDADRPLEANVGDAVEWSQQVLERD
jgi:hypothetical protein